MSEISNKFLIWSVWWYQREWESDMLGASINSLAFPFSCLWPARWAQAKGLASVRDRALPASYFRVDICSIASLNLSSKSIEPSRILSNIYVLQLFFEIRYLVRYDQSLFNRARYSIVSLFFVIWTNIDRKLSFTSISFDPKY